MKKLLMIFLSCLLMGCTFSSYTTKNYVERQTATSFYAKYSYFQGYKNYQIYINESKGMKFDVISLEGSLNIKVSNGLSSFYEGTIDNDFSFTLNLNIGRYDISITGKDHNGSYSFSW